MAAGSYKTVVPINQMNDRPANKPMNEPTNQPSNQPTNQPTILGHSCNFIYHALQYHCISKL